jgi:hypothetical protein
MDTLIVLRCSIRGVNSVVQFAHTVAPRLSPALVNLWDVTGLRLEQYIFVTLITDTNLAAT